MRSIQPYMLIVVMAFWCDDASACRISTPTFVEPVREIASGDQIAPTQPIGVSATINRLKSDSQIGDIDCSGAESIHLAIGLVSDDYSLHDAIGFKLKVMDAKRLPMVPMLNNELLYQGFWDRSGAHIFLQLYEKPPERKDPIDFWVTVTAVDEAGNESAESKPVHVYHAGFP